MKRLTVHLKHVTKKRNEVPNGKSHIYNTLAFNVNSEVEAEHIVAQINDTKPKNNVSKWYVSNIK